MAKKLKMDGTAVPGWSKTLNVVAALLGAGLEHGVITREQVKDLGTVLRNENPREDELWCLGYNLESNYNSGLYDDAPVEPRRGTGSMRINPRGVDVS